MMNNISNDPSFGRGVFFIPERSFNDSKSGELLKSGLQKIKDIYSAPVFVKSEYVGETIETPTRNMEKSVRKVLDVLGSDHMHSSFSDAKDARSFLFYGVGAKLDTLG